MKSLKKERYDGFFGGLYKRNEVFIMLSAVILLGSIFAGYAFAGVLNSVLGGFYGDFQNKIIHGQIQLNTFSLFFNNLNVALLIYIGGAFVGIISAGYLIFNGLFIGYAGTQFPLGDYLVYTLPPWNSGTLRNYYCRSRRFQAWKLCSKYFQGFTTYENRYFERNPVQLHYRNAYR